MTRSLPLAACALLALAAVAYPVHVSADESLAGREEQAMQAAVERIAPSVVSIDTVGGLERAGQILFGTGPTTGLIVSDDGYIVSSAFNFAQKPTSILVGLADGTRTPARIVATDRSRMLVLLKIQVDEKLAVPEVAPEGEVQVGQWSIAVGRTFDTAQTNMSVGIVSATGRIWGKALQTDAKISPSNYGGPLVDIRGRVLGVLVPLSPTKTGEVTGVEWYDSGIGFAAPLSQFYEILPKLKQGKDLVPGIMGVSLQGRDMFAQAPVIANCRPNSPAYKAGFKTGDKIVEVDGHPIERLAQLHHQINRRYSGDKVQVAVLRGRERIERELELIDKLAPYQRPFLGVLPRRDVLAEPVAVSVRYVYPGSPAEKAGLKAGDLIHKLAGEPVKTRDEFAERMNALELGQKVHVELLRGAEMLDLEVQLGAEPNDLPSELPPARLTRQPAIGERPPVGAIRVKVPDEKQDCFAYVPEGYDPEVAYGLIVWLHAPGGFEDDALLKRWKDHCDKNDLVLLAPKSKNPSQWQPAEVAYVHKAVEQVRKDYKIDPLRVVAHGHEGGAGLGCLLAKDHRDLVRAVAAVDFGTLAFSAENDPVHRLAFYVTTAKKSKYADAITRGLKTLRDLKYSVAVQDLGDQARYLNDAELTQLVRWIDALDRF